MEQGAATADKEDFNAQGKPTLFQLSFPLLLHSLLSFFVNLADTAIISAYSAEAAAAVAVAKQVMMIAFELSGLVGIGAVIVISRHLGRREVDAARQVVAVALLTNTLVGLALGLSLVVAGPFVLEQLAGSTSLNDEAGLYLNIVAVGMVFNGFIAAGLACLRAFGHSRLILAFGVGVSAFYLLAEWILILGVGSLPGMGVTGAALGTFSIRVLTTAVLTPVLMRKLGLRFSFAETIARPAIARRMIAIALPSVTDYIAYSFYQIILLGLVARFGVEAVLGRTYTMLAMAFLIVVVMAISQSNEVLIGYRFGERRLEAATSQALRSASLAAAATTSIATLIWLASVPYIRLFTDNPAVIELCGSLLFLTIFIQPGFAFNTILFQSLRAVGDVRWPVFVSLTVTWGLGLSTAWFFCLFLNLGVTGVWLSLIIEETVKGSLFLHRWLSRGVRHEAG
jgi:putative MATE family efflux protein